MYVSNLRLHLTLSYLKKEFIYIRKSRAYKAKIHLHGENAQKSVTFSFNYVTVMLYGAI